MPTHTAQQFQDIGPAELTWKGNVLGKTVANPNGGTHGGVGVKIMTERRDVLRDAKGTNPHDKIIVGRSAEVESNLTGLSLSQMKDLIPGSTLSAGAQKSLQLLNPVGMSERESAGLLIIKPIDTGVVSTDESEWLQFALAFPVPNFDFKFDLENQKVFNVMWDIFDDLTTGNIATLGQNST
jgi:hypothetical protein